MPGFRFLVMLPLVLFPGRSLAETIIRVPADVATLSAAVAAVPDGGTIELASGTYTPPVQGFFFPNLGKGLTIRAESGGNVVLDGGGAQPILRFQNTSPANGDPIVLERLTFRNGRSTLDGVAGGVTLHDDVEVTFLDCTFEFNSATPAVTGGGAVAVFNGSVGHFVRNLFADNSAKNEGGALRVGSAEAYVHDSQFLRNRTNLPGHRNSSGGGAIHLTNSILRVTNSRFEANEAGFVGGAIFALGDWLDPVGVPSADVVIANSTFVDNKAQPDPGVTPPSVTEAGATMAENQATMRIFHSRFVNNSAQTGGAANSYRGILEIRDSVFLGNRATGTGSPSTGFGGSINVISDDTGADGANNRRPALLMVTDSYFQGRFGGVTTVGQVGGGIFVKGDANRAFGLGGVTQMGTVAENRATAIFDNVIFADLDVVQTGGIGTGVGGGMSVSVADLTLVDSLFIGCDSTGPNSNSGALRIVNASAVSITGTAFARNSAANLGGAILAQGSDLDVDQCAFVENGISDPARLGNGAAIFAAPLEALGGIAVTGSVASSLFSNHTGLAIFDDDRQAGPINDLRYNGNSFFETSFGSDVYVNPIVGQQNVAELNNLTVNRTGAPSTVKSQIDNVALASLPVFGALLAAPPQILAATAAGDPASSTESYLAWAWSGGSATLDGSTVTGGIGSQSDGTGVHTLSVAGQDFLATISQGVLPGLSFSASPASISSGQSSLLSWSTTSGSFVDLVIDQAIGAVAASGSTSVTPVATTTWGACLVTAQGGAYAQTTVFVDESASLIFADGFESGDTTAWN